MDLKAVLKEPGAPLRLLQSIAELTISIRELPMVVLGRVNGAAIGGGCGLGGGAGSGSALARPWLGFGLALRNFKTQKVKFGPDYRDPRN